ncbi:MAG TPA: LURP-one-related family protein, partial [Actinomycetota bacterium]|nr:LURP-one-related family protein [Actinomycetota bacterium]
MLQGPGQEQEQPRDRKFVMRSDLLTIGDDYWIEDEQGNKAYHVDGKAMRIRDTWVLEDANGREVATIKERKLTLRDKMKIERDGKTIATVHRSAGWGDRFKVEMEEGEDLKAHGKLLEHEYEIERDGQKVAHVSKKWFSIRDSYGIHIEAGEDEGLLLAAVVAIDAI